MHIWLHHDPGQQCVQEHQERLKIAEEEREAAALAAAQAAANSTAAAAAAAAAGEPAGLSAAASPVRSTNKVSRLALSLDPALHVASPGFGMFLTIAEQASEQ